MVNKSLPIEKLRKHVVPFAGVAWQFFNYPNVMYTGNATGAAALGAPAVGAQGAAPVASGKQYALMGTEELQEGVMGAGAAGMSGCV